MTEFKKQLFIDLESHFIQKLFNILLYNLAVLIHKELVLKIFKQILNSNIIDDCECIEPFDMLKKSNERPSHARCLINVIMLLSCSSIFEDLIPHHFFHTVIICQLCGFWRPIRHWFVDILIGIWISYWLVLLRFIYFF